MGFPNNESHFQEDFLSINGTPVDWEDGGCTLSEDPSWAASAWLTPVETALQAQIPAEQWHQILLVKMQIWHCSSTRGAALYLSEACLLSAILAQGSKRGTWDQHARWPTCICTAHFEKAFPFNEFRSHECILVQDFWTLRDNFLSILCQQFYCY